MVQINSLNDHGLAYSVMGLLDLLSGDLRSSAGNGCYCGHKWLTPETCYWLYLLLKELGSFDDRSVRVMEFLKNGTNHPELL